MWFNIYLIDRRSSKPSSNSKIAYFEILSPENRPVVQKRILLENGFGPGHVVLPDTLSSVTYTIKAYTNWMKNFLPFNCFLKDIKVYNPLRTKAFLGNIKSMDIKETTPGIWPVNSGLNLNVNNLKKDSLEILITSDEIFRSENSNVIYLFIQTHGIINHLSTCRIADEITRIAIPKNTLTTGINQITIFDTKGPVADRFIYTPGKDKQALTLHSIDSCKQRNKVTLEMDIENGPSDIQDLTNLSISVATKPDNPEIMSLDDYLVLGTEFGIFPGNLINGRKITELPPEVMDSVLLTLKSNWINWTTIFSDEAQLFKNPPEKEEYTISGRLMTGNLQPVYADEILLISTPGKEAAFQYTRTDQDGNFDFRVHIDDELKDLILQPDIESKNQEIYIESPFSDQYLPYEIVVDSSGKSVPPLVIRQSINYQVRKIYGSSSVGDCLTPAIPPLKSKRFYGTPDFELIMKDYIKLDSMPEVFFELVPHVTLGKINSVYEISITDAFHKRLEGAPCVMIDGVIIKDLSAIANLDPDLVEKIDVIWEKYRVGNYLFNGIVNVISKTGDFSNGALPVDAIRLHYRILDPVCSFVSPDYSSTEIRNSPVADYRNTLYWNPSVKPDKNGRAMIEFWTADIKSDYIINLLGITSEGKTVSLRKMIKVR
ncbi:MAG: hypothetical protein MUO72_19890 [Bacteroidales bacterium]|nr:hypothetical protein [Bacteroidales bacterium]